MRFQALLALALVLLPAALGGQTRSMAQDSTLDNQRHPPGIQTTPFGALGRVRKDGQGDPAAQAQRGDGVRLPETDSEPA